MQKPSATTSLLNTLLRILSKPASIMNVFAGWAYVAMALFITADVISRQLFGFNSKSTTELSGYLLAFGMSWALAHAMIERAHIRIDVLVNRVPLHMRQILHVFSLILLVIFVGFLCWGAFSLINESLIFGSTDISALSVPLIIPQGLWAFGLVFFGIFLLVLLANAASLLANARAEDVERLLGSRGYQEETVETLEALGIKKGPAP
jgi:TRAP-type C4-dicarboxylate transport system permease small subunit